MEDCGCIFAAFVIHLKKSSCFTLYYRLYYSLHYSCCLSHSPQVISALSQELHLSTLSKYLYSFVDASLCHPSFFLPRCPVKTGSQMNYNWKMLLTTTFYNNL